MLTRYVYRVGIAVFLSGIAACTLLPSPKPGVLDKYMLEYHPSQQPPSLAEDVPVMIITVPGAHGGYDTARIAYMQKKFGLRYYTRSRWADTPARMLAPLLAEAINETGQFQAVYGTPGALAAQLRLDGELIRFHQDFTRQPSEVHITLRVQLVDLRENRVLASQLFDVREVSTSEDTYGGVLAANRATERLLAELARFCVSSTD